MRLLDPPGVDVVAVAGVAGLAGATGVATAGEGGGEDPCAVPVGGVSDLRGADSCAFRIGLWLDTTPPPATGERSDAPAAVRPRSRR